jgi:hypothetical protein
VFYITIVQSPFERVLFTRRLSTAALGWWHGLVSAYIFNRDGECRASVLHLSDRWISGVSACGPSANLTGSWVAPALAPPAIGMGSVWPTCIEPRRWPVPVVIFGPPRPCPYPAFSDVATAALNPTKKFIAIYS